MFHVEHSVGHGNSEFVPSEGVSVPSPICVSRLTVGFLGHSARGKIFPLDEWRGVKNLRFKP